MVVGCGGVYDLGIVCRSCQSDGVFFTFLQQHHVESCLDFLLAGNTGERTFLCRCLVDAVGILACLTVDILFGNQQTFIDTVDGRPDVGTHGAEIAVFADDHRIAFR